MFQKFFKKLSFLSRCVGAKHYSLDLLIKSRGFPWRRSQTLKPSRQRALGGIMQVREKVAVERPAEGEEIQGLAALLLSRGADRAAGLQDPPLRAALREKHAAHQPPQGFEAGEIHQNLGGNARGILSAPAQDACSPVSPFSAWLHLFTCAYSDKYRMWEEFLLCTVAGEQLLLFDQQWTARCLGTRWDCSWDHDTFPLRWPRMRKLSTWESKSEKLYFKGIAFRHFLRFWLGMETQGTHWREDRWSCHSHVHLLHQDSRSIHHTATVAADTHLCCRRTGWKHMSL